MDIYAKMQAKTDSPSQSRRERPSARNRSRSRSAASRRQPIQTRPVNFRPTRDEVVLLDQVACKLAETITVTVTVKDASSSELPKSHRRTRNLRLSRAAR